MLRIKKNSARWYYIWIKFFIFMVFVRLFPLKIWNQFLLIFFFICVWCIENWLFSWLWNHEMFYFFCFEWVHGTPISEFLWLNVYYMRVFIECETWNRSFSLFFNQPFWLTNLLAISTAMFFTKYWTKQKFTFYILHDYFVDISS